MPHRLADDPQPEFRDDFFAHTANRFDITKKFSRTTLRID
jgi:hypothetical protein